MRTTFRIQSSDVVQTHLNSDDSVSVTIESEPMPEIDEWVVKLDKILLAYNHDVVTRHGISNAVHNAITKETTMAIIKEHLKME